MPAASGLPLQVEFKSPYVSTLSRARFRFRPTTLVEVVEAPNSVYDRALAKLTPEW